MIPPLHPGQRRGFQRSRALWDRVEWCDDDSHLSWRAVGRAIRYELQPVRGHQIRAWADAVGPILRTLPTQLGRGVVVTLETLHSGVKLVGPHLDWRYVVGVIVYCGAVRWIHQQLEAGPFVVILTVLALIFTIGLSDEENDGSLSAYSVFNKGFQKILGSVDSDALLQQYVGGAGAGMMMNMNMAERRQDDHDEARFEAQRQPRPRRIVVEEEHVDDALAAEPDDNHAPAAPARRSNKKMRRRDADQRRDIQQQRQAAAALGFDGNPENEVVAWQRLQ